jgi:hypothetical protein
MGFGNTYPAGGNPAKVEDMREETIVIEKERLTEAKALIDLARYVLRVDGSLEDGTTLQEDEQLGLGYLLENVKALLE